MLLISIIVLTICGLYAWLFIRGGRRYRRPLVYWYDAIVIIAGVGLSAWYAVFSYQHMVVADTLMWWPLRAGGATVVLFALTLLAGALLRFVLPRRPKEPAPEPEQSEDEQKAG